MAGPTVRRRQLGRALEALRNAAGVSRPDAAAAVGCSLGKIGHIETGRSSMSKAELVILARDLYGVDGPVLSRLEELLAGANRRGWWSTYGLSERLASYVGLEADATSVRCVELEVVPGLLQTEDYARMIHLLPGKLSREEVTRCVALRMQRQQRLTDGVVQLSVVVSESALVRCLYHPDVAAGQLRHLLDRGRHPGVDIRVLPFAAGMHVGVCAAFALLSFPDNLLPDVAWQGQALGGQVTDDPSHVAELVGLYDEVCGHALSSHDSSALISGLAERFSTKGAP